VVVAATSSGKQSSGQAASSGGSGGAQQQATVASATHGVERDGGGGNEARSSGLGVGGASTVGEAKGSAAAENTSGSLMTASSASAAQLLRQLPWWPLASPVACLHRRARAAFEGAAQRTAVGASQASELARIAFERPCAK
jgi:hypothetical protein